MTKELHSRPKISNFEAVLKIKCRSVKAKHNNTFATTSIITIFHSISREMAPHICGKLIFTHPMLQHICDAWSNEIDQQRKCVVVFSFNSITHLWKCWSILKVWSLHSCLLGYLSRVAHVWRLLGLWVWRIVTSKDSWLVCCWHFVLSLWVSNLFTCKTTLCLLYYYY